MDNDPSWAHLVSTESTPTALNMWNGRPVQFLLPLIDGSALLWWEFDLRGEETAVGVIVHLTDAEAQTVFNTPPDVGILEVVRPSLIDTEAAVFVFSPQGSSAHRLITIPRTGTEENFIDYLFDESDEVTLSRSVDKLIHRLAGVSA